MTAHRVQLLAALLALAGIGLCLYKSQVLQLPLRPDAQTAVWTVEARASLEARGKVKAQLVLPSDPPGFRIIDEHFVSRDFGLALEKKGDTRYALWSIRQARGPQTLYYRIALNPQKVVESRSGKLPGYPPVPDYPELYRPAIESLLSQVRAQSADIASFTRQLIRQFNVPSSNSAIDLLQSEATGDSEWARQIVYLLAGARIPARVVYGLRLKHGVLEGRLEPWLEVHNESEWLPFDPRSGDQGYPPDFLVWKDSAEPTLETEGARLGELRFSVRRGLRDSLNLARHSDSAVIGFSLLGLPLHVQNVYTILLTVPLGALLVVLLRNFVGVQTFGTFMPVLIALSFRETELLWGVVLFLVLVTLGLTLRFVLENLKLLLVPRLASVLIIVILLMLGISIASYRIGFDRGLSVALFPMVILAMTIERMSVVWEEHGPRDAILRGLGSLLVAMLAFVVMNNNQLQYLLGMFPELLLVVLAVTLLIGRYTGYRLTEFWRFRSMLRAPGR